MGHQILQVFLLFSVWNICSSHSPIFQTNSEKCPLVKTEVDYIPHGSVFNLGNLTVYETNNTAEKRVLIAVYDMFGESRNSKLFADFLGETYGFRIAMPDFFRGKPWDYTKWPPSGDEYEKWCQEISDYETIVKYDIQNLIHFYRETYGITEFGTYGFCWGAKISGLAAHDFTNIKVTALVHPSNLTQEIIENIKAPTYLFPCKDDPDMIPFYETLQKNFGDNSGHLRYNDMCHGFATAMGNYSEPLIFQRVEQTIHIIGNFFLRNFNISNIPSNVKINSNLLCPSWWI